MELLRCCTDKKFKDYIVESNFVLTAYGKDESQVLLDALKDIDKMVANAILLDTVVASNPSKKMGKTSVLVHHLYCPVQFADKTQKVIAKLYITESFEVRKKFYLNKIEMSPDTRGSVDNESTPPRNIGSASDDKISVAEIYTFVNEHDVDYEKDSKNPVYFKPNQPSEIVNDDGTPKMLYRQNNLKIIFLSLILS